MSQILLCCGASAALHKGVDLASKLTQAGHRVRAVLTPSAAKLISPQLFEAVTSEPASVVELGSERRGAMDHIELSTWAEAVLVAPATADLISRMALGLAGDLVTTTLLAIPGGVPRMVCPAMNPNMLANPAVGRNLGTLREDGWRVLDAESGHMACGVDGQGRLPEVEVIVDEVASWLGG